MAAEPRSLLAGPRPGRTTTLGEPDPLAPPARAPMLPRLRHVEVGTLDGGRSRTVPVRTVLLATVSFLVVAHLAGLAIRHGLGFRAGALAIISLTAETSIGTWVSAGLLALAAAAALTIGRLVATTGREVRGWTAMALLLLVMSIDEVAAMHERAEAPVREALGLGGFLYFAWVLPALAIVGGFVAWQWPFLRSIERRLRSRLALAGTIYVAAAVGLEMVEAKLFDDSQEFTLAFGLVATVEEAGELGASALAMFALWEHLAARVDGWTVRPVLP